ncbi:hypothetical protein GGI25_003201 [Coemansia spiralis]|uniref:SPX domain-containing protein n=2 Tax=Coemansia TaxID=4863 RepID=A0A9W8G776_9FUNG|nr:SPX domain-containing protein [Coemansia spiralis]KAJ1991841.1 hypothetical protein EDC05_003196 [Coemansia umbellata]KAJ2621891.1 hypothetical protein GGI26_003734 [Coemansia sp. RSA 1358]KAJ2677446.1 hypothetical protein GGI25_003201 [Coemansia spiralis]
MKFGKTIETSAKELPSDWQPYIIQYKLLKKNIKQIVQELDNTFKTLNLSSPTDIGECATQKADDAASSTATATPAEDEKPDQQPNIADSIPEEIEYNIEKDSNGVVHPVIVVKIRKPASTQHDHIVELPGVARIPSISTDCASVDITTNHTNETNENGIVAPKIASSNNSAKSAAAATTSTTQDTFGEYEDAAVEKIKLKPQVQDSTEETQVIVHLEADQMFFDQLLNYIERMQGFEQKYTKEYNANVTSLGNELTAVTSPFKHDFQTWREIFRLYIDADVWDHSEGECRSSNTAKEGQSRFEKFTRHIDSIGLTKKFRDPVSARLLMSFYKLNMELSYLKLLQEMNELATRKIIKKHDKRTHLIAMTQFPQIVNIDTTSLTKALIYTVYNDLVGVVPQIDDYLCPMCLNISWRPLRLGCTHVFCSRCIVKASRRRIFNCPLCRSKDAIYNASVADIDKALMNFLKLYFPKEIKEKQRDIQREIAEEETAVIISAHAHDRPCIIM